jgi:Fe(3+) dicitrate transport protein
MKVTTNQFRAALGASLALASTALAPAQSEAPNERASNNTKPSSKIENLNPLVVTAESEADHTIQETWLPDVIGTSIFSGKKTAVLDMDKLPVIIGNNYRQALSQTPGLLLSEETSPLVSIGYRGLNPGRAQFTQVLRDGIPIHADQFGYAEAYYTPPLDTVDRIEFVHGGASLLYGPQPGGSLNYITHNPRTDKEFSLRTQHVAGSNDLYSTFTSADGTVGKLGYYGFFNHRQSDGFRSANSGYDLDNGAVKLIYTLDNNGKIIFNADTYREAHGEPGGLRVADFNAGKTHATRMYDRFELERDFTSIGYEISPDSDSFFTATAWWSDYLRYSERQRGGGFGTLPTGATANTNTIENQRFQTLGLDVKYRRNWGWNGATPHTVSSGIQLYQMDSPRTDMRGASATASTGTVRNKSDRSVFYAPVFVENRFSFGNFSITPGIRVENSRQKVTESVNLDKTSANKPLGSNNVTNSILLSGLGAEYKTTEKSAIYSNLSQSYRPIWFTQAVPSAQNAVVNGDLEEGKGLEYELGYRGRPNDWLSFDASAFVLSFTDQIGSTIVTGGTSTGNVGDAIHKGIDLSTNFDLLALITGQKTDKTLDFYVNTTLLDAKFTKGPSDGFTPQYAPDFMVRTGFIYTYGSKAKISLLGTFLDDHTAITQTATTSAAELAQYKVPAYMVFDLTAEYLVHENIRLLAGINNLFDESYYSRVTGAGIDPGYGRNFYVGTSLEF